MDFDSIMMEPLLKDNGTNEHKQYRNEFTIFANFLDIIEADSGKKEHPD